MDRIVFEELFGVKSLPDLIDDLKKMSLSSRLRQMTKQRCVELNRTWPHMSERSGWLELLRRTKNPKLWSMRFNHVHGEPNLRILYADYDNEPLLLHAFIERNTKPDYDGAIQIATSRYRRVKANGDH